MKQQFFRTFLRISLIIDRLKKNDVILAIEPNIAVRKNTTVKFMNTKCKMTTLLLAALMSISSIQTQAASNVNHSDPEKDKVLLYILRNILTRSHFVVKNMNDDFSEYVFTQFINSLDPNKRYFTQKDIKDFEKYKYVIDNQLLNEDISFYNLVYGRFTSKIKNAKSYYRDLLEKPFNFNKKETIDVNYEQSSFAKNENQLKDYWRKQLKLSTLIRIEGELPNGHFFLNFQIFEP